MDDFSVGWEIFFSAFSKEFLLRPSSLLSFLEFCSPVRISLCDEWHVESLLFVLADSKLVRGERVFPSQEARAHRCPFPSGRHVTRAACDKSSSVHNLRRCPQRLPAHILIAHFPSLPFHSLPLRTHYSALFGTLSIRLLSLFFPLLDESSSFNRCYFHICLASCSLQIIRTLYLIISPIEIFLKEHFLLSSTLHSLSFYRIIPFRLTGNSCAFLESYFFLSIFPVYFSIFNMYSLFSLAIIF